MGEGHDHRDVTANAEALVRRGRSRDALRLLHASACAAARRASHHDAGWLWLRAARICRRRGRVEEAKRALDAAEASFAESGLRPGSLACRAERAWLACDDGRWGEAGGAVGLLDAEARETGSQQWHDAARWLARFVACRAGGTDTVRTEILADADVRVDGVEPGGNDEGDDGPVPCTGAVAAWVCARSGVAGRETGGVEPRDGVSAMLAWEARVLAAAARGDAAGARAAVEAGLAVARAARDPLGALGMQLTAVEAGLDDGARVSAAWSRAVLPGLYRQRLAAITRAARAPRAEGSTAVPAAVALLDVVNGAPDERTALRQACAMVRERSGAWEVAIESGPDGRAVTLASAGPGDTHRWPRHRRPAGGEVRAAIRYGGAVVGDAVVRVPAEADRGLAATLADHLALATAASVHALRSTVEPPGEARGPAVAEILGASPAIAQVRRLVQQAAATPFPVLVEGESGTGKELAARAVHLASERRARRFCAVNCAALTDELVEAELFGHARGAFTGAAGDRAGLFEEADGGTLFLDEVGELSPRAQAKLLRAIQEREVRRIGENHYRRVDVRLVCATNRALPDEVLRGRFRQDLLYRLDVIRIAMPPLRARPEDIPLLVERFWRDALAQTGGRASLTPEAVTFLAGRPWPGNVRQLQNALAALATQVPRHGRVGPADLAALWPDAESSPSRCGSLGDARAAFERAYVRAALHRSRGRRGRAAAELGVTRQGLAKLIRRLGLEDAAWRGESGAPPAV